MLFDCVTIRAVFLVNEDWIQGKRQPGQWKDIEITLVLCFDSISKILHILYI